MMQPDQARRRVKRLRRERAVGEPLEMSIHGPIHDAVRPCLTEITYLAQRDPMPPNDVVYDFARTQLHRAKVRLDGLSLPPLDREDIHYALVAYIDEVLQARPELKEFWQAHLLQLEHFGETRAGEGFFDRLERAQSDARLPVLRVYYVCLLLGFRGIYGKHGDLERENLIARLRELLGESSDPLATRALSPFGARPDEPGADRRRNRLLQSVAVAAMTLSTLWYVALSFVVDAQAQSLVDALHGAYVDLKANVTGIEPLEGT